MSAWKCPECGREFAHAGQPHYCGKPQTVEEYIETQDEDIRPRLLRMREILRVALPEAQEKISWSMPTYWKGRNLIHFAAAKKHIGLYPGDDAVSAFEEELTELGLSFSKGTIRLPHEKELPEELLVRIARWCQDRYGK